MKKLLSTLFIIVAVLQIGGITPFYFYCLQLVKAEGQVELEGNGNFETIRVSMAEYNNAEVFQKTDEHEFFFRGKMYDFKSVARLSKGFEFYALNDQKESALESILSNNFQQTGDTKTNKSTSGKRWKDCFKDMVGLSRQPLSKTYIAVINLFYFENSAALNKGYSLDILLPPDVT